jgi:hypothetical protein
MHPEKPRHIAQYAEACLEALAEQGLGNRISLGGAFGLSYYLEYRPTHDIDAWWGSLTADADRRRIVGALQEALNRFGVARVRAWGDVVSVDLEIGGRVVFSFQIASRTAQLEESKPAPWPPGMMLDSFRDLLAAKMVALVERGAPRDFRDVYAVCEAGLADPGLCWSLWQQRRRLSGDDTAPGRARLAILTHLERIELHRPLETIPDQADRARASTLRTWFRGRFLDGIMD